MFDNIVFKNEYINLIEEDNQYYIKVRQHGYTISDLNEVLKQFPRVKVTQFITIQSALNLVDGKIILLGDKRPKFELQISKDKLSATAVLNMSKSEFEGENKQNLVTQLLAVMTEAGIIFGFELTDLIKAIVPIEKFEIAHGISPIKGEDAWIQYYEIHEAKPEVYKNGDVNHYELNLINKVNKGDWVGERHEPKEGIPGKTITGQMIPALRGHQVTMKYDRKSIDEQYDPNKDVTYLLANRTGAVVVESDVISVCNYLEIEGKVSFKTGNVDFDGYVDVKDVVEDNFTVKADNDIQIKGDMGIGGVDHIESREGSIYIRGGIAGKGKAKVICDGDLYTKFAADCDIECGGTVHIGYYAMNCNIRANEIIFDAFESKVIGGTLNAKIRIQVGTAGNRTEVPTILNVEGFRREKVKEEYEFIADAIDKVKDKMSVMNQKKNILEAAAATDPDKYNELLQVKDLLESLAKNLKILYEKQKKSISYLKAKGEGELIISKQLFPKVQIGFACNTFWNSDYKDSALTYYLKDQEILKI